MRKLHRIMSLFLAILLCVTTLPFSVFAANNDGSGSNVGGSTPTPGTTITKIYEGLRISIYWCPPDGSFETGEKVMQIGKRVDFSKTPMHSVSEFTALSVYDYMNRGYGYMKASGTYSYYGPGTPVVKSMPGLFGNDNKKELWDEWFEGPFVNGSPTYKNIPAITKLTGYEISAQDFANGIYDNGNERTRGQYKIFFEPIAYPTIDGKGAALTLRDAINHPRASYLLEWIAPLYVLPSNAQYLIEDEPAIKMYANKPVYTAVYTEGATQRAEIKKQVLKGGKIYNSMGVGVVSTEPLNDQPTLVKSFVKVVGVDSNGKLIYEQMGESVEQIARIDEKTGFIDFDIVDKTSDGEDAILNDIITSPIGSSIDEERGKVTWGNEDTPTVGNREVNLTAKDIKYYTFGVVTAEETFIDAMETILSDSDDTRTEDTEGSLENHKSFGGSMYSLSNFNTISLVNNKGKFMDKEVDVISGTAPYPPKKPKFELSVNNILNSIIKTNKTKQPQTVVYGPQISKTITPYTGDVSRNGGPWASGPSTGGSSPGGSSPGGSSNPKPPTKVDANPGGPTNKKVYEKSKVQTASKSYNKQTTKVPQSLQEKVQNTILEAGPMEAYVESTLEEKSMEYILIAQKIKSIEEVPLSKEKDVVLGYSIDDKSVPEELLIPDSNKSPEDEVYNDYVRKKSELADRIQLSQGLRNSYVNQLKEKENIQSKTEEDILVQEKLVYMIAQCEQELLELEAELASLEESYSIPNNKASVTLGNNKSGVDYEVSTDKPDASGYNVAYLRYIVVPKSRQINVIKYKKNGIETGESAIKVNDLPIQPSGSGGYEVAELKDIREEFKEYKNAELLEWWSNEILETQDINKIPSSNGKYEGSTLEQISDLTTDQNIYVFWEINELDAGTDAITIPEWRLSKYTEKLGDAGEEWRARMDFKINRGLGCCPDYGYLSPEHSYSNQYNTINPNGLVTTSSYDPDNMNMKSKGMPWFHSKVMPTTSTGSFIDFDNTNGEVFFNGRGNLNSIKNDEFMKIKGANWITTNKVGELEKHGIKSDNKGVQYSGQSSEVKNAQLEFGIKNKTTYKQYYTVSYSCGSRFCFSHHHNYNFISYTPDDVNYTPYVKPVVATFERYKQVSTDSRLFKLAAPVKSETNGKATLAKQEATVLNIYPEYAMLFQDDKGTESIEFAVGDLARKIQPISYHSLEYKLFVAPKSTGTSVATASQARAKANSMGLGQKQVVHKGSGVNTTFEIMEVKGQPTKRGLLEVKTYALDISDNTLKSAWGNSAYNTKTINDNFINQWEFKAKADSRLEVANLGGAEAYKGPNPPTKQGLEYKKVGNTVTKDYKLTIRGGRVTHVDKVAIATIKSTNKALYDALEGMKIVGGDKGSTVFSTFEHQVGKSLTEQKYKDMAKAVKDSIDNLDMGKGWYSEDTTVLKITEYITTYEVPSTSFADKLPMTINGLNTPINKMDFYQIMFKGHTYLKYEVESKDMGNGIGKMKAYFEANTRLTTPFNEITTDYLVPNVSITDTMGYN